MAISAGNAALQVVPVLTKNFSQQLATQMAGPAVRGSEKAGREHGRRFGHSFSGGLRAGVGPVRGILRGFGPQLAAAFGGAAIVGAIKSVTDEAREAAVVGKQTAAVLKSTGGVAKVTAKHVSDLAESISNATGVDDEMIQTGQNWLLTFKNVRNETGKGNAVFDRASQAAVDLAASMHQGEVSASGLHSATTQLGKALNDPVKGMTALARAGVTFNAEQQKEIKTLVAHGNLLGAQKIILGEVESQTKGFAAASADAWQRMSVVWNNAKETIGTALLPVLERVANRLAEAIPNAVTHTAAALRTARDWWDKNKTSVEILAGILANTFIPSVQGSNAQVHTFADTLANLNKLLTRVTEFTLRMIQVWLMLEHTTIGLISIFGSLETFAGHVINVIDKLSGGTGHAGDQFIKFGQQIKETARKELAAVRVDAQRAQQAIDRLHGKAIDISATTSLHFTKTFTQKDWMNARLAAGRQATGGPVGTFPRNVGPPGGKDTELRWLDPTEHVWTGQEVAAAGGHKAMKRWRKAVLTGQVPGMVQGGAVGIANTDRAYSGVNKIQGRWARLIQAAGVKEALAFGGGMLGGLSGPGGWRWQMAVLRRAFPGLALISGFRPGAVTHATGRQSYHAVGRAVDVPPRMDVFNWIRGNYGQRTKELIFSPAGSRQVHNGRPHMYTGVTRADHFNHVHWAYDKGGMLPPGTSLATNNTGKPERVLGPDEPVIDYRRLGQEVARALAGVQLVVKPENLVTGLRAHKRTLGGQALGLS